MCCLSHDRVKLFIRRNFYLCRNRYAKYFKMLKMGLPAGAVKNALQRDGHDPTILDLNHDKSLSSQLGSNSKCQKNKSSLAKNKPAIRRKKVYWNKVDAIEGTIWSLLKASGDTVNFVHDTKELESLFTQRFVNKASTNEQTPHFKSKSTKQSVKVIDAKRGMNGDIILKKLKLNPTQVTSMVDRLEFEGLDADSLRSLYDFLPSDEEIKGLTKYLANVNRDEALGGMTPCEQYMVAMKDTPESEQKIRSMIFSAEFKSKMTDLKYDSDNLLAACNELRNSERFRALLAAILKLVNQINSGEESNKRCGFTLDTLIKISEVSHVICIIIELCCDCDL